MANLTSNFIFVLTLNAVFFLGQIGINQIQQDAGIANTTFYTCENTTLSRFGSCATYQLKQDPKEMLPNGNGAVSATTSGFFVDIFSTIANWINGAADVVGFIWDMVAAPATVLTSIGLPPVVSWTIGGVWYGYSFLVIILFLLGRGGE